MPPAESARPPDLINGYAVHTYTINLSDGPLRLLGPRDPDALLDDPRTEERYHAENEFLPYWARPWGAAVLLAEWIVNQPAPRSGSTALELGCGLGLVGLAAARRGWRVTLTDYDADAIAFAGASAALNAIPVFDDADAMDRDGAAAIALLDWTRPPARRRVDLVLAADILFEARWVEPVAAFLVSAVEFDRALIADPDRRTAAGFSDALRARGMIVTQHACSGVEPDGAPVSGTLYDIRPASV
jgi:predicted nicotinamide N-methyase